MPVPSVIHISYERHVSTGLIAGLSRDLPGLMAVGRTIEAVDAEIPVLAADLIYKKFGVSVQVSQVQAIDTDGDGFAPLSNGAEFLIAA